VDDSKRGREENAAPDSRGGKRESKWQSCIVSFRKM